MGVSRGAPRELRAGATALTVAVAVTLSGCVGTPTTQIPGDYPNLSLRETAAPAQALRDLAAARVPAAVVSAQLAPADVSVACLSVTDDPGGLIRAWLSSIDVTIVEDEGLDLAGLVNDLSDSFVADGWTARALGGTASVSSKLLDSPDSPDVLQVTGLTPNGDESANVDDSVTQSTVRIQVQGPCVRTDGPHSAEVEQLEK